MWHPSHDERKSRAQKWVWTFALFLWALAGCASSPFPVSIKPKEYETTAQSTYAWMNRLTWGWTPSLVSSFGQTDPSDWIRLQLQSPPISVPLPEPYERTIRSMSISQGTLSDLVFKLEQQRKSADALTDEAAREKAKQTLRNELNRLAHEAATRHLIRALYSPSQIREQMTWFWLNHFSVYAGKHNLRAMIGDYEENAIRVHALGRFRDLLGAATYHPAMLRYLDNERNAGGRINENHARELMELHTLGVDGGYTQKDVQELARALTGLGVNLSPKDATVSSKFAHLYVRRGLFEFNPHRHDASEKVLLGSVLPGQGLAEMDAALDRLARHPSTARYICRKLASYWFTDLPPEFLIDQMVKRWTETDGQIAPVLATLFASESFASSKPQKFKDPMRYLMSALRLAYDGQVILNMDPVLHWMNRMGEPLYGRQTPDGYPLDASAWNSPGQMATRIQIAKTIGTGEASFFRIAQRQPKGDLPLAPLSNEPHRSMIWNSLGPSTRDALEQARSPQAWNTLLLSSPDFMWR